MNEVQGLLARARDAQRAWAETPLGERLRVVRRFRIALARDPWPLVRSMPATRAQAETLAAEILPLAEAARFLERQAVRLLRPRRLWRGRPLWLWGVRAEVRREPFGVVLILAPSNYPIMLPGIQALQALVAGNAALVKPAPGCCAPARALAAMLASAGVPEGVLTALDESMAAGEAAVAAGVDKIVLTGSAATGARVLAAAASHLTPATMELSGCDAVFVLEGADLSLVADCVAYGLRLNAGATCIAPRRIFVAHSDATTLEAALLERARAIAPTSLPDRVRAQLGTLIDEAEASGARVSGQPGSAMVVANAHAGLRIAREDVFAPVVSIIGVDGPDAALRAAASSPYALGASVFGPAAAAAAFAGRVRAGSVVVNDIVAPTADPRLAFGGRGASGFGVTRGPEGLLEMTVLKAISVRHGGFRPHLLAPAANDAARMAALLEVAHGARAPRLATLRALLAKA